jgi:sporulation protein YlmC with PRC-barrel domain
MKRSKQSRINKHVVSAVAVAGMLSLGNAPVWAQQGGQKPQALNGAAEQGMITARSLEGTRVIDKRNREIGSISNLFIDPQGGKILRAGIEFDKETFGGKKYSVAWEQMSVKRQDGKIVVALDESVIDQVQNAAQSESNAKRQAAAGREEERARNEPKQADRGTGVLGLGRSNKPSDEQQISASQLSSGQIRKIQQELNKEGFDAGQVNGQWSSETQTALRNFQESKGLRATGELDKRTISELGLDADEMRREPQPSGSSEQSNPSSSLNPSSNSTDTNQGSSSRDDWYPGSTR